MSADFLQSMAAESRRRVAAARQRQPDDAIAACAGGMPAPPALRLHARFDLIAELKRRSPGPGASHAPVDDLRLRVTEYAAGGAAAVSVLTEPTRFDGSIFHLLACARALHPLARPAMRKDFLVDAYQLAEARIAGAGGALLVLRLLASTELESLITTARRLKLFLLLEAFDERDLELASGLIAALGPEGLLVGVNCRDLATLEIVPSRLQKLAERLPAGVPCVAESGIGTPEDVRAVARAGYRLALVGTALMKSSNPAPLVREMLEAGRTA